MTRRIGLAVYDMPAKELMELAITADRAGFDCIWLGEHIVLPVGYGSEHPTDDEQGQHQHITGSIVDPATRLVDQFVAFGAVAAVTTRIRMATGIHLLPLRHPLATARAAATLQELSSGRFVFGAGAGWLREEFEALGIDFRGRMGRFEESVALFRRALGGGPFEFDGTHFRTPRVQLTEEAVAVPVILGGNSPRALRRAATLGDGWFVSATPDYDESMRLRDAVLAERTRAGLPTDGFATYLRIRGAAVEDLEKFSAVGVDDVVVWADQVWTGQTWEEKRASLVRAAVDFGIHPG